VLPLGLRSPVPQSPRHAGLSPFASAGAGTLGRWGRASEWGEEGIETCGSCYTAVKTLMESGKMSGVGNKKSREGLPAAGNDAPKARVRHLRGAVNDVRRSLP